MIEREREPEEDKPFEQQLKPISMSSEINENPPAGQEVTISREFIFLYRLIYYRIRQSFRDSSAAEGRSEKRKVPMPEKPEIPEMEKWRPSLRVFVLQHRLNDKEKILLLIALAPYIYPDLFDMAISKALKDVEAEKFSEIGGVTGKNCPFFLPTGETVIYLINGPDKARRFEVQQLFGAEHLFWEKKILWVEDMQDSEPPMHGRVVMSSDYVHQLITGSHRSPQFSISFPAKKIAPLKDDPNPPSLEDLVIPDNLLKQIRELMNWLEYKDELMKRMKGRLKKGYRTLFYGPPGTGKTFAAEILGYELKKDVYKIDLSMVVSKYIGETEKNLELLFTRAEDTGWILFFDEADALFGKRTNVRDAHDKYANQEVSYLLQRIEDYNGLVILATNMKNNIDDAFVRRFNSMLRFPFPDAEQRAAIWRKSFPPGTVFREKATDDFIIPLYDDDCNPVGTSSKFDLADAVKKYELTGGNIVNVIQYAGIKAIERLHNTPALVTAGGSYDDEPGKAARRKFIIYYDDVKEGIRNEMIKEGRPFMG
jgi:hypothetical protein